MILQTSASALLGKEAKAHETLKMTFRGDRKRNIELFASSALDTLRKKIEKELNN